MSTILQKSLQNMTARKVSIVANNNRLRIEFRYNDRKMYLSLGLADTEEGRSQAELIKLNIENDLNSGKFDPDKLKSYRLVSTSDRLVPSLLKIWDLYIDLKSKTCSEQTILCQYNVYTNHVKRFPTHDLSQSGAIVQWCLENLSIDTSKRLLTRLSAACDYAIDLGMIGFNPFKGRAAKITNKRTDGAYEEIDPFTEDERDRILDAILNDTFVASKSAYSHSYYYAFIKFLFLTGCRTNEATALKWENVNWDRKLITFNQSLIRTANGKKITNGLKTQKKRIFPMNQSLTELFAIIEPVSVSIIAGNLVFPSPKHTVIDANNLRNRLWYPVLEGLNIRKRGIYQTRHTAITMMVKAGLPVHDVARLVGNSTQVIIQHYLGASNVHELNVPNF